MDALQTVRNMAAGTDILYFIPHLLRQVESGNEEERIRAVRILATATRHVEWIRMEEKHDGLSVLVRVLDEGNPTLRAWVERVIKQTFDGHWNTHSLEALNAIQNAMEALLVFRLKNRGNEGRPADPHTIAEDLREKEEIAFRFREIAKRKAGLARVRNGELLAGETIQVPQKGRGGMYRLAGQHPHAVR